MNFIAMNELDTLLKKDFFKKKSCWVKGCSNKSISIKMPNSFLEWWYSNENKWRFICPNLISIIEETLNKEYYAFVCYKHEINWFLNFLPKKNNYIDMEDEKTLEIVFTKYQSKFFDISISLHFLKWLHFFVNKMSDQLYPLEISYGKFKKKFIEEIPLSEYIWIEDETYFYSVPFYIKELRFSEYIGTTRLQGKFNGPDFILFDSIQNLTIGFELFEYQPLMTTLKPDIKDVQRYLLKIEKVIKNKMEKDVFEKYYTIRDMIIQKVKKSKKYKTTDNLILAITLNAGFHGYEYYSFEFWLSIDFLILFYNTNIRACIFI